MPRQSSLLLSAPVREAWILSLPPLVQPWGELLFSLGFARLFDSLWFWLPLGLLLLNSLVALADYSPGSWQRLRSSLVPTLKWQHPLAHRAEQSTRLPESPDTFLDELKTVLTMHGFYLYQPSEGETRLLGAGQRRWAWLGPTAFYLALIILIIAAVVSYYFLEIDALTLRPRTPQTSPLFAGKFELIEADASSRSGQITYVIEDVEPANLTWNMYMPMFFKGTVIWPHTMEPILTVEARDKNEELLRLIPSQENLSPAERLHLSLANPALPVYFLIPTKNLAFQIVSHAASPDRFDVKVRQGAEPTPSEEIQAQAGKSFVVEDVTVNLALNSNITATTLRDPALPLYLLGLGLLVAAGISIFWQPPLQLWFMSEVKGRGGQLYSVVEKFGRETQFPQFLQALLNKEA